MLTDSDWDHRVVLDQVAQEANGWLGVTADSCFLVVDEGVEALGPCEWQRIALREGTQGRLEVEVVHRRLAVGWPGRTGPSLASGGAP